MILLLGNNIKSDCSQTLYNITDEVIKCQTKYTVGIIPKSNIKIVERGEFVITNTQIHALSLSWISNSLSLTHRYMLSHFPGLVIRYH